MSLLLLLIVVLVGGDFCLLVAVHLTSLEGSEEKVAQQQWCNTASYFPYLVSGQSSRRSLFTVEHKPTSFSSTRTCFLQPRFQQYTSTPLSNSQSLLDGAMAMTCN